MTVNERVLLQRHGGADQLKLVEAAMPVPQRGEVVLRVQAAGVAYADVLMRRGLYPSAPPPPFVPGFDVVGLVEQVGDGVTSLAAGDRVAALTEFGGYSRFVRLPASRCVPVPEGVDSAEAVALVVNYLMAHQMLHQRTQNTPGESILVHGAAGGVGTALLQLGKLAGLNCYGTASRDKHATVEALGGVPIDYQREDFVERVLTLTGDGVDVVFDPIGGEHWIRSYRTLKLGGTLMMYGASSMLQNGERNPASQIPGIIKLAGLLLMPDGRRTAIYLLNQGGRTYREDLTRLLKLLQDGDIRPLIGDRLPLADVAYAHEQLENAAVSGKIVLMLD